MTQHRKKILKMKLKQQSEYEIVRCASERWTNYVRSKNTDLFIQLITNLFYEILEDDAPLSLQQAITKLIPENVDVAENFTNLRLRSLINTDKKTHAFGLEESKRFQTL